jgi:uncharacterized membrane protein
MSYEEIVSNVVKGVEAVGASILIVGGFWAFVLFVLDQRKAETKPGAYVRLRRNLGRPILVGLEVLIVADIVRTIIVDQTLESVGVLAVIVIIRILLSFSLEVEMDGMWPWVRWRQTQARADDDVD